MSHVIVALSAQRAAAKHGAVPASRPKPKHTSLTQRIRAAFARETTVVCLKCRVDGGEWLGFTPIRHHCEKGA